MLWSSIDSCRICGSSNLASLLDLGSQPPANALRSPEQQPPTPVPLRIFHCADCSTIQLGEVVNPDYLFSSYLWVTGTSTVAQDYSKEFARKVLSHLDLHRSCNIVEVASNDGTFLQQFRDHGHNVLGIDPAQNIAEMAQSRGIPTLAEFFTNETAEAIASERSVDCVIARNVIPHVKDLHSVISGMSTLISESGLGVIEFHDSNLLLTENQYDYIYHEHLYYFTLSSMTNLLSRHRLYPFDVIRSPISGGSWVVFFTSKPLQPTQAFDQALQLDESLCVRELSTWRRFTAEATSHKSELLRFISKYKTPIPAFGASARSSTLLNYCCLNHTQISFVIDNNPLKQGLLTPGSHIPIRSYADGLRLIREEHPPAILLLAWNFKDEIVASLRHDGFHGDIICPLPGQPHII